MTEHTAPHADRALQDVTLPDAPRSVMVTSRRVACDGETSLGLGHPRVWLAVAEDTGMVECGYCDTRYILDPTHAGDAH
ncbi:MAG: zinc-finger domain-containing protein [Paracoccus sp. (in: a-proteobacteria)]|nr:zinc-finger domain-containing protein [Paracoccus sp. (in: a-proteobacteria)]